MPTNLESLTEYFYSVTRQGGGDGARGRNLLALFALEFAYRHELLTFRPSRKPQAWLAMLVDIVSDHLVVYSRLFHERDVEKIIEARLEQPWGDFLQTLESLGLRHIAVMTDEVIQHTLELQSKRKVERLATMPLVKVFSWLPSLQQSKSGRGKHPVGKTLRNTLSARLDPAWHQCLSPEIDACQLIASLPPSGLIVFELCNEYFERLHIRRSIDLCELSFTVFYARSRDAKHLRDLWQPQDCFIGHDDTREEFELYAGRKGDDREHELVSLGLAATFPKTIHTLDRWLESCETFPEFHAGQAWCLVVQDNLNDIQAAEAALHARVVQRARVEGVTA